MKIRPRKILKFTGIALATSVVIVCLLGLLAYVPPVQRWLVNTVGESMEESLGMKVHIDDVRITPFLDLVADGVTAVDTEGDTLVRARRLTFDVAFRPLFAGCADIDGFSIDGGYVNTKSIVADCHVKGTIGNLKADAHGIEWTRGYVHLDQAVLNDADLRVVLTDTAARDTTRTRWLVDVERASLSNCRFDVSLPADTLAADSMAARAATKPFTTTSLRADVRVGNASLTQGKFDLFDPTYAFSRLTLENSSALVTEESLRASRLKRSFGNTKARIDTLANVLQLNTTVDTLTYLADGTLDCNIVGLGFSERTYALNIHDIAGPVHLDSQGVRLPSLAFRTPFSQASASLNLDWAALSGDPKGQLRTTIDAAIDKRDVKSVLDYAVRMHLIDRSLLDNDMLKPFLTSDVNVQAVVSGNLDRIDVESYNIELPQLLAAKGNVVIDDGFDRYAGSVKAKVYGGSIDGTFKARLSNETYSVKANVVRFPVREFVKTLPAGPFTGKIDVNGRGFDVTSPKSRLDGDVRIATFHYDGYDISGLTAHAALEGGLAHGSAAFGNQLGHFSGTFEADLRHGYDVGAHLVVDGLHLDKFIDTPTELTLNTIVDFQASVSKDFKNIEAQCNVTENYLEGPTRSAQIKDLELAFATSPRLTKVHATAGDMKLDASIDGDLDYVSRKAAAISKEMARQLEQKAIDQQALRNLFPDATLSLHAVGDNPLHNFLRFQGTVIGPIDVDLAANVDDGVNGHANIEGLTLGGMDIDDLHARIWQDEEGIKINASIRNYKEDNPNRFFADIDAYLLSTGFGVSTLFTDQYGRVGTDLKLTAEMTGGRLKVQLDPEHNTFAYQHFKINDDNFISISKTHNVMADVRLVALEGTSLQIYSEPTEEGTNDITLSIADLDLDDLCNVIPSLPRIAGTINGDFHVIEEHAADEHGTIRTTNLSAMGSTELRNFVYAGTPMGSFGAEIIYLPKENGEHYADAFISYEGQDVGECSGVYFDTTGLFNGEVSLHDFPLYMFNAFLDGTDFKMRGYANGEFTFEGPLSAPAMNGSLTFDDAHIYSPVYGADFMMESRPLMFKDSKLEFDDYALSSGKTQLLLNGNIDLSDLADAHIDLTMHADRFELINARRTAASLVFGKVLADYNGTVKGCMDNLAVRGQVNILPSTDATYLLSNSPLTVEDRLADLVTFTDFSDTTTVVTPTTPESESTMDITLSVNISDGARFHCFLSANGSSYVDVRTSGNLTLRMPRNGEMRLTGRCTVLEGEMNYELPVVPLKKFAITQGSYVEFTGDMYNPRLAITATEQTKAVYTEDDVQRSVNFVVGVDISRTLDDMGLAFTIEAPEDLGVQNKLTAMSAEDRYKAAVALLATGMFVTEDLTTGFKASNALNAFLQSEIQNIAGKALSTFDLSFGMENGTSNAGTMTTDYSFRFSKRFLDDRFAINIGGSVSTGLDATNDAASFIDNVSIEYRLDNGSTRYVRIFYDRNSHDPLEGSMMKTGAGLVLRRKTDRLSELFLFRKKKDKQSTNQ